MENTRRLDIPGARGKVEVDGVLGLLYKVRIDGEIIKRSHGYWAIPTRKGGTAKLTSNGVLPGFQTLRLDGTPILKMGAHVQAPEKAAMFAPAVLVLWTLGWVPVGAGLAVLLFLMNVIVVKNPNMPRGLRIALPLVNTAVMAFLLTMLFGPPF
ncbi:hypothetical protein [Demequina sp.]|uniref:hypothetical protein n=1 Tax=Demequina sp. TaxID=2050685 RepID=UPI0025DB6E03|nr:hypothetical protein [Demequina sp.]